MATWRDSGADALLSRLDRNRSLMRNRSINDSLKLWAQETADKVLAVLAPTPTKAPVQVVAEPIQARKPDPSIEVAERLLIDAMLKIDVGAHTLDVDRASGSRGGGIDR